MHDPNSVPNLRILKAALRAGRVFRPGVAEPIIRVHHSYAALPSDGVFRAENYIEGEEVLVRCGLLFRERSLLRPALSLSDLIALHESEGCRVLLSIYLDRQTPAWLRVATARDELSTEYIPEDALSRLVEVIPDPDERQSLLLAVGRKFDATAMAETGAIGELAVVKTCRQELYACGRPDLANEVRQVSRLSDQLGYDVVAPRLDGSVRRLEVKTTRAQGPALELFLSRNEAEYGQGDPSWALVVCRRVGDNADVVGWWGASEFHDLLPVDRVRNGIPNARWTSAKIRLFTYQLRSGLPPIE